MPPRRIPRSPHQPSVRCWFKPVDDTQTRKRPAPLLEATQHSQARKRPQLDLTPESDQDPEELVSKPDSQLHNKREVFLLDSDSDMADQESSEPRTRSQPRGTPHYLPTEPKPIPSPKSDDHVIHIVDSSTSRGSRGTSDLTIDVPPRGRKIAVRALDLHVDVSKPLDQLLWELRAGFKIPPYEMPASDNLPFFKDSAAMPPIYIVDAMGRSLESAGFDSRQLIDLLIDLHDEHRVYCSNKVDDATRVATEALRKEAAALSIAFLGEDVVSHRIQMVSGSESTSLFIILGYYAPDLGPNHPRPEFYSPGPYTIDKLRRFRLEGSTVGRDTYTIQTQIPKGNEPSKSNPLLHDPTLFLKGRDVGLGLALYNLVYDFSMKQQLDAMNRGACTFVIGRIAEHQLEKSLKQEPRFRFFKTQAKVKVPGVRRSLDDGSVAVHQTSETIADFTFTYKLDADKKTKKLTGCVFRSNHLCYPKVAPGPSTVGRWAMSMVQGSELTLINELSGAPPLSQSRKLALARENLPGANSQDLETFASEMRELDTTISDHHVKYLHENYAFAQHIKREIDITGRTASEIISDNAAKGFQARVQARLEEEPEKDIDTIRSEIGRYARTAQAEDIAKQQGISFDEAQSVISARGNAARTLKQTKGEYYDDPDSLFDSSLLAKVRYDGRSKLAHDDAKKLMGTRLYGFALTQVINLKFEEAGLAYPLNARKEPYESYACAMGKNAGFSGGQDLNSYFKYAVNAEIVFDIDAPTSSNKTQSDALRARVKRCKWLTNEGWDLDELKGLRNLELLFIVTVLGTPMVKVQRYKRKERWWNW